MEENNQRKAILLSLAALLIGSLLYIFGISIKATILPLVFYYAIAILLYLSAFLCIYNQNKKQAQSIYFYLMILTIGLITLITYITFQAL